MTEVITVTTVTTAYYIIYTGRCEVLSKFLNSVADDREHKPNEHVNIWSK